MEIKVVTPEMAEEIIEFVKIASGETANLITTPEEFNITIDQETKYLQSVYDSRLSNMLVMLDDGKIVGQCGMHGREGRKRISHVSSLGITILKSHWSKGIGSKLIQSQIEYAKANNITKINLEVRVDNIAAINLYKKMGFVQEGINRRSMLIDNEYVDTLYMGIML